MPELPEVETIVSDLKPVLVGRFFVDLVGTHENTIIGALDNVATVRDKRVVEVSRRGKFINIFFENDYVMTIHLRMSGRIISRGIDDEILRFERMRIDFNSISLRFCDVRKFGRVWICKASEYEEVTGISRLGVEPLNGDLNLEKFTKMMNGKSGVVKKWLLDQSLIAGVGNIYADEGCFYAGIRPGARMENLKKKELEKLFEGVLKALRQGIKNRGTSISDFQDANGRKGRNQELLYVYGRGGEECLKCKNILKRTVVAGRGTVYCEQCQK
ncbi:bifunctional DNA-formamidopyrimidine glycosylase/DNA-(apurinic or apyrimidinic site) lyase [Candidatus Peregrinibacteria bacterium]|nr:bifunctional DNA-formamidopyrimidine glycosylase/DNA-(apurinic or apyrimidinic site) lyase [Candidatus Peregrinibacteria bacterium]